MSITAQYKSNVALMKHRVIAASPAEVPEMLEQTFVKKRLLEGKYVSLMKKFYALSKAIIHNEKTTVAGIEYDRYSRDAKLYVDRMKKLVKK